MSYRVGVSLKNSVPKAWIMGKMSELELSLAMAEYLEALDQPWPGYSGLGKGTCWQLIQHLDTWHEGWESGMSGGLSVLGETVAFDSVFYILR